VQFRVDGVDIGSPDTTAPYSASWNTTGATSGSHTVTAVATDTANNVAASGPVGVTVSQPPPPPPSSGLVGAWSFDAGTGTQAVDSSPSGNNGTLNGPTWETTGKVGGALSFDGVNDRVDVPDAASLDLTRLTVEAWVRPSSSSDWRTLVMKERSGGLAYALYSSNAVGRPEADLYIGADRSTAATSPLPVNTWSHVAMTYDGAALKTYVNGVEASTRAQTGNPPVTANALRIGGNTVWGEYFAGLIDEVRIYNRALTATEIQADMSAPVAVANRAAAFTAATSAGASSGADCGGAVSTDRVVGPSAEHSPAHHALNGCCGGCCGSSGGAGGGSTSQVDAGGASAACSSIAVWTMPFGRPPDEVRFA
jgi:hypothetical protein